MKLRKLATSLAAAAALSAPVFAHDVVVVPVTPPDAVMTPEAPVVVVTPPAATTEAGTVVIFERRRDSLTEPGGMTPRERADTAGQRDPATGTITAPGYQGPRSTKGQ